MENGRCGILLHRSEEVPRACIHLAAAGPDPARSVARAPGRVQASIGLLRVLPLLVPSHELGAAYPDRPIRLIVPFPPGGGTDLVSRTLQPEFQARLGQQLVLDNRGGAQALLGTALAAQSAPDGYTLVVVE